MAAQIYYQNSCRYGFSGMYLVFEVFQGIWHSNKKNPCLYWHATLSCPFMCSNLCTLVSRSDLVLELTIPWTFGLVVPISFCWRASRFKRASDESGALLFLPFFLAPVTRAHFALRRLADRQADRNTYKQCQPISPKRGSNASTDCVQLIYVVGRAAVVAAAVWNALEMSPFPSELASSALNLRPNGYAQSELCHCATAWLC